MADPRGASPARAIAARVLVRVWESDAFAAAALDAELRRHASLDPRDLALATELVYGVLRTQGAMAERLARFAPRRTYARDPEIQAHLLIGAYSLCFLDRVPAFAAVSEAASAIGARDTRVAAFANAVLRKLAEAIATEGRPRLADAVAASAPGWLRGALRRALGRRGALAYLAAEPVPPPIGLSLAKEQDRERWLGELRRAAPEATVELGRISPRAITVRGAGDVRRLPGYGGAWIIQEEGAQVLALAVGARAGERVLDACAGRGNKVWILGHDVVPSGALDAADIHPAKLEALRRGPTSALVGSTYAVDWSAGVGDVPAGYDRVLVDAPCSGVGTLRRRPEIGLRRREEDLPRLQALQLGIVRRAATRVRDGGRLLYGVCSVLTEECEAVVERLVSGAADAPNVDQPERLTFEPASFEGEPARSLAGASSALRLLPHEHQTDGYFVASFVVRRH